MTTTSPQGRACAVQLARALAELSELEKTSCADANALWVQLANHLRSARPQALMTLKEVP